jgi:hypothetical protein
MNNSSNHNEITILLTEYKELFREIRNIHEKRILLFKMVFSCIFILVAYIVAGIVLYIKSKGNFAFIIPQTLAYIYSLLGIILATALYFIIHNGYYYIGPSKKHTVRSWKAIHAIRARLKKIIPSGEQSLILPDSNKYKNRPNLSRRWEQGIFLYPIYHIFFYITFAILIMPFFAIYNPAQGLLFDNIGLTPLIKALTVLWPLLLIKLALGSRAMKRYWENIRASRFITSSCIFPKNKEIYNKSSNWHKRVRYTIWWGHFFMICFPFIIFYYYGFNSFIESIYWWKTVAYSILLTIILGFAYLSTYDLLVRIKRVGATLHSAIKRSPDDTDDDDDD